MVLQLRLAKCRLGNNGEIDCRSLLSKTLTDHTLERRLEKCYNKEEGHEDDGNQGYCGR